MYWLGHVIKDGVAGQDSTVPLLGVYHDGQHGASVQEPSMSRGSYKHTYSKGKPWRRCVKSSVTTSLATGIIMSFMSVLVKQTSRIQLLQFLTLTSFGSWVLSLTIAFIIRNFFTASRPLPPLLGNRQSWPRFILVGASYAISIYTFYYAIDMLRMVEAVTLFNGYSVIAALFACLFIRAPCGIASYSGVLFAIVGFFLVVIPLEFWSDIEDPWNSLDEDRRYGMLCGILSAVVGAIGLLISGGKWDSRKKLADRSSPLSMMIWSFQIQLVLCMAFICHEWPEHMLKVVQMNTEDWVLVGAYVVCATLGRWLACWVIERKSKSFVRVLEATHIIWASVWAYCWLGEIPPAFAFGGACCMLVGISILSMDPQHNDDDIEDWNLDDEPNSEYTLYTEGTIFQLDANWNFH